MGKQKKPFHEFVEAQKEIRSQEGSVGWQLRNGNGKIRSASATRTTTAVSGATWKPPAPGEKLWSAGKVWKTAPRAFNLEQQKYELLKVYEKTSALLQECGLL